MIILAFDTSMAACSVCVYDAARDVTLARALQFMDRGQAEALAPMVQNVVAESGFRFADISRIAVTIGPGTFTGVRIGLAMARGLGLSLGIPAIGINSLAAIAANEKPGGLPLAVAADARMGEVYFATFDKSGLEISAPAAVTLDDARKIISARKFCVVGTGAELVAQGLDHARGRAGDLPVAANFARLAATLDPADAPPEPLYLRAPDVKPQNSFLRVGPEAAAVLAELHAENFATAWNEKSFAGLLASPGTTAILHSSQNTPTGFMVFRKAADETEIITICTRVAFRRKGLAKALLQQAESQIRNGGAKSLFIEVAMSNTAALALYAACGFTQTGSRKNYYDLGNGIKEDALTMVKRL
jgi:tRNA threonylcarbamoyl adenosine modification protein YeaZ/ribosomal-protein-alanine acetyltransferase